MICENTVELWREQSKIQPWFSENTHYLISRTHRPGPRHTDSGSKVQKWFCPFLVFLRTCACVHARVCAYVHVRTHERPCTQMVCVFGPQSSKETQICSASRQLRSGFLYSSLGAGGRAGMPQKTRVARASVGRGVGKPGRNPGNCADGGLRIQSEERGGAAELFPSWLLHAVWNFSLTEL